MPNKCTPALDAVEFPSSTVDFFGSIFGKWKPTKKQSNVWYFLADNKMTSEAEFTVRELFWCFIAELSDQDLQECFPELFSDLY